MPGDVPDFVNIVSARTGQRQSVSPDKLGPLLAGDEWRVETPAEGAATAVHAGKIEGYGINTLRGALKATASEFLGGVSGGLTQLAESRDPARREEMQLGREVHPTLTAGANLLGAALPAALSGGAGAAGAASRGTIAGQIGRLGAAIAGKSEGALARTLRGAVAGGLEGGLTEAGAAVGDDAIANDQLSIERLGSSIGHRFLFGFLTGAPVGGAFTATELALRGAAKATRGMRDASEKITGATEGAIPDVDVVPAEIRTPDVELGGAGGPRMTPEGPGAVRPADIELTKGGWPTTRVRPPVPMDVPDLELAPSDTARRTPAAPMAPQNIELAPSARQLRETFGPYQVPDVELGAAGGAPASAAEPVLPNEEYGFDLGPAGVETESPAAKIGEDAAQQTVQDAAGQPAPAAPAVEPSLAGLDKKGLREAETFETKRIVDERVPLKQQFADDVNAYREQSKLDTPWNAVASGKKGSPGRAAYPRWVREAEKVYLESHKMLDRVLRDPKGLALNPGYAAKALRQEESALENIMERHDELQALHLGDRSGRRAAALEKVPQYLENNRKLQATLADLTSAPASPKLAQIADARDALDTIKNKSLGSKILGGVAYSTVSGATHALATAAHAIPGVGPLAGLVGRVAAPFLGAMAADVVSGDVAKALAGTLRTHAEGTARALEALAGGSHAAVRAAPILASKILGDARFAPVAAKPPADAPSSHGDLLASFQARAQEMATTMATGPDGMPHVRPEIRERFAEAIRPIAMIAPLVADRLETFFVKRHEYVHAKMPRYQQIGSTRIPPSEMEIRSWARTIAVAYHPELIEQHLARCSVTPEDAECLGVLYPARLDHLVTEANVVIAGGKKLKYQHQLALGMLSGGVVHGSMDPGIMGIMQASHGREAGTNGGMTAPKPMPAFASVKKLVNPTPHQERAR